MKPVILIIDDDRESQRLMAWYLKGIYKLANAVSVPESKRILESNPIDLILLDLSLAGREDGLVLTRYLRKTKRWKDIPIIVTTAHAFTTDQENCLDAGCNDYLTKPIKREDLLKTIGKYLK